MTSLTSQHSLGRDYFRQHFDLSIGEAVRYWNTLPSHAKDQLTEMAISDDERDQFEMVPPWDYYDIPAGSIGWRMGYGEEYMYKFWNWYTALLPGDKQQFQRLFPTPPEWEGFYYC